MTTTKATNVVDVATINAIVIIYNAIVTINFAIATVIIIIITLISCLTISPPGG